MKNNYKVSLLLFITLLFITSSQAQVGCTTPPSFTCTSPVNVPCNGVLVPPAVVYNCTGNSGNAVNVDGTDDQITGSDVGLPSGTAARTIESWVKFSTLTSPNGPIFKYGNGATTGQPFELAVDNNGKAHFWAQNIDVIGSTLINDNLWHHVAVTYDGSIIKLYVDGNLEGSNAVSINTVLTGVFYIGNDSFTGWKLTGSIDEVRVWNVVRTQTQIKTYRSCELSAQTGLVALYHFNQGIANGNNSGITTLTDDSGNNYNGTLLNFALTGTTSNWVEGTTGIVNTLTNNAPAIYPSGNTTVTWTAQDIFGNSATCDQIVTLNDTEAPILLSPSNQIVNVFSNTCVASYTIADPISDNCTNATWGYSTTGATTLTSSGNTIPDGTGSSSLYFNKGVTTVSLTGTDGVNPAVEVTFTITVNDAEAPLLYKGKIALIDRGTCTFASKVLNAQNAGAVGVIIVQNSANPPVGISGTNPLITIPVMMVSLADGATIKAALASSSVVNATLNSFSSNVIINAPYNATLTATKSATFGTSIYVTNSDVIYIQDTASSYLGCSTYAPSSFSSFIGNQTLNAVPNTCSASYTIADPISDNCTNATWGYSTTGATTLTSSGNTIADGTGSGSLTFNKGVTTVTLTGTDGTNPATEVTFTVTVNTTDSIAPTLVSQSNQILYLSPGTSVGTFTILDPISDNCSGATWGYSTTGATTISSYGNTIADGSDSGILNFNPGLTTVTLTGTDGTNLATEVTFTINVNPESTITCSPAITINTTLGICTGTTLLTEPVSSTVSENALSFDGIDDSIETNTNITNLSNGDFTIEAWIKTSGTGMGIVTCSNDNTTWENGEKAFYISTAGYVNFVGYGNDYIYSSITVNDNKWHHVAVTWDWSSGNVGIGKMYIDGNDVTYGSTNYAANNSNLGTFKIGKPNYAEATNYFNGIIDGVRIWNVARTQTQIQANRFNSNLTAQSGLMALYNFNQGIANANNSGVNTLIDSSGNNYNGILNNFALSGDTSNWVSGRDTNVFTNNAPASYPNGNTDVTWTITNGSGSISNCNQTVTVIDNEAPLLYKGKIALIDRGTCTFASKILNAQNAGAIGVIIVQNTSAAPIIFGGNEPLITIPSMMISLADGATIKAALASSTVVNATLNSLSSNVIVNAPYNATLTATKPPSYALYGPAEFVTNSDVVYIQDTASSYLGCSTYSPSSFSSFIGNQTLNVDSNTCLASYTIVDPISDNCTNATWGYTTTGATTLTSSGNTIADGTDSGILSFNPGVTTITLTGTDGTNAATEVTFTITVAGTTNGSITTSTCDTYTWSTNNQTYTNSGTYTYIDGCNTATLELTIVPSSLNSTAVSACDNYTWAENSTNYTTSGTYSVVTGCHTEELVLTIDTLDTTTSLSGSTLTANQSGATYQWVDCNNANAPIANETNQSFTPSTSGNYAVVVTLGSCSATSICNALLGVNQNEFNSLFQVYPNPFNDIVTISINTNATIEVYDVLGKIIQKKSINTGLSQLDLRNYASGVYLVKVTNEIGQTKTAKLIKK